MSKLSSLGSPDFHINISRLDLCMSTAFVMNAHTHGWSTVCQNTTFKLGALNVAILCNVLDSGLIASNAAQNSFISSLTCWLDNAWAILGCKLLSQVLYRSLGSHTYLQQLQNQWASVGLFWKHHHPMLLLSRLSGFSRLLYGCGVFKYVWYVLPCIDTIHG